MTIQKLCVLTSVLALTACATAQENPNYQYSSKYNEHAQTTQLATNSPSSQAVYVSPEMRASQLNRAAEATSAQPNVTYANSTTASNGYPEDVTVVRPSQVGTPGYGVYVPETVENYDYSENVVSANSPVVDGTEPVEYRAIENSYVAQPNANYIVGSGDTVYNIARRLCVNVEDVQTTNALGNDFSIKIGQPLYLPQSHC